ncbi:MAG: hypothetical protein OEZ22_00565 [Spirochaetia bacterium]|nr:hypothetical protein [Spirochaetia bacterium]
MNKYIKILGDKKAGFILTLLIIILLITGSIVMNFNTDIYPPFFEFDINYFINPFKIVHLWFYCLFITLAIFGINIFFCSLDSLFIFISAEKKDYRKIISFLAHLGLLLALLAHLIEGFFIKTGHIQIGDNPVQINGMGTFYLKSLDKELYHNQKLKDIKAVLAGKDINENIIEKVLSYNEPLILNSGTKEILIQGAAETASGVSLRKEDTNEYILLDYNNNIKTKNGNIFLQGVEKTNSGIWLVYLKFQLKNGTNTQTVITGYKGIEEICEIEEYKKRYICRHISKEIDEEVYFFSDILKKDILTVTTKYNPGVPLALLGIIIMTVSLILQIWQERIIKN